MYNFDTNISLRLQILMSPCKSISWNIVWPCLTQGYSSKGCTWWFARVGLTKIQNQFRTGENWGTCWTLTLGRKHDRYTKYIQMPYWNPAMEVIFWGNFNSLSRAARMHSLARHKRSDLMLSTRATGWWLLSSHGKNERQPPLVTQNLSPADHSIDWRIWFTFYINVIM